MDWIICRFYVADAIQRKGTGIRGNTFPKSDMVKYKIIYERKGCIGAGSCTAIAPKFWKIEEGSDMKADLQGSELDEFSDDLYVMIIDESELQENLDAAKGCPAQVIHIINLDTGEKLI